MELQYLNNYTGITGCIGLLGNQEGGYEPVVNFSGLIGTGILSMGANVAFDISTRTVNKLNAGFSFNSAFLAASLTLWAILHVVETIYKKFYKNKNLHLCTNLRIWSLHCFFLRDWSDCVMLKFGVMQAWQVWHSKSLLLSWSEPPDQDCHCSRGEA